MYAIRHTNYESVLKMSYLRPYAVIRWGSESNKSVFERSGMGTYANGVKSSVVE